MEYFSEIPNESSISGLIATPFKKKGMAISHLLFANDALIFA